MPYASACPGREELPERGSERHHGNSATVRKRPTAHVVSIDQAQRAGKYQKRPQAHGSASRNQRPATAMDITAEPSCIAPADRKSSARYASIFGSVVNSRQWSGSTDGKTIR
jgi:hypothetical protein